MALKDPPSSLLGAVGAASERADSAAHAADAKGVGERTEALSGAAALMQSFEVRRPGVHPLWLRLERIRRRVPYAYWLFYDLVFVSLLVFGLARYSPWFAVGLPFLGLATFFDVVEFFIKATEERFTRRLFEGTGPPTPPIAERSTRITEEAERG